MRKLGRKIIRYQSVTSTNEVLKGLAMDGIEPLTVVVAKVQTKGRGRMERTWESPEGGLWLSALLDAQDIEQNKFGLIPLMTGVAVAQAISRNLDLEAKVKWPNDVLINDRKVCGILGELIDIKGRKLAIIGIGVNVLNPVRDGYEFSAVSTSLVEEVGDRASLEDLESTILEELELMVDLLTGGKHERILDLWREKSATLGHKVKVTSTGSTIEGLAKDIDENGSLLVETPKGIETVIAGDCEIISE